MRAKLFQLFKRLDKTEPFSETIWFLFLTLPAWIYLVMTTATPFTRFYVITQFFGYTLGLLLVIWMVTTLVVPSLIYPPSPWCARLPLKPKSMPNTRQKKSCSTR